MLSGKGFELGTGSVMTRSEWNLWTLLAFAAACANLAVICLVAVYCETGWSLPHAFKNLIMDLLECMS